MPIPYQQKAPVEIKDWRNYRIDSAEEFPNRRGNIGVITGQASGGLIVVDLDHPVAVKLAPEYLPKTGLIVGRTQVPANHWFYRVDGPFNKIEFKHLPTKQKFIEVLGDGQQVVIGPSVHPSGDVYDCLDGEPSEVDQDELIDAVGRLYEAICDHEGLEPYEGVEVDYGPTTPRTSMGPTDGDRPGDDYNARGDVRELLLKHGWKRSRGDGKREYWTRPGKKHGISATLLDGRVFFVFSSSTELDSDRAYSPFSLFARLEHGGDFTAATKDLARQGFGKRDDSDINLSGIISGESDDSNDETSPNTGNSKLRRQSSPKFIPFPLEILPRPVAVFCEEMGRSICCDPTLILLPALSVMAGVIGNSRRVVVRSTWSEPAIVWTAAVSDSGSGKSPAFDAACRPALKLQKEAIKKYEQEMAQYQVLKSQFDQQQRGRKGIESIPEPIKPELADIWLDNTTVEAIAPALLNRPRGSMIICEELSGWFQGFNAYKKGGGDEAFYLSAYGGRPSKVNRKGGPKIFIPSTVLSVAGTIQPAIAKQVLSSERIGSGFAARFYFSSPPEQVRKWSHNEVPNQVIENYEDLIYRLSRLEPELSDVSECDPKYVGMTRGAQSKFIQFYDEVGASRPDIDSSEMKAAWSKLEGGAARLALVFACARFVMGDKAKEIVDEDDIDAGIQSSRWFAREAERIYSMIKETDQDGELRELIEWIDSHGGEITSRELSRNRRQYRDSTLSESILQSLVKGGFGEWIAISPDSKGGRPSRKFSLFPCRLTTEPTNTSDSRGFVNEKTENGDSHNELTQVNSDLSCILANESDGVDFDEVASLLGGRT